MIHPHLVPRSLSVFQITPLILMDLAEKTVRDDEETKIIYNLDTSYDLTDNITFNLLLV